MFGVSGDDFLVVLTKLLLYSLSIRHGLWKMFFQKSIPQTHLLMNFNSIEIMGGYK